MSRPQRGSALRAALGAALAAGALAATTGGAAADSPSEAERMRWTCGHLGSSCMEEAAERLQVRVWPRRTETGRRTRFVVRVTVRGEDGREPVRRASVRFAGASVRTDAAGRAVVVRRLRRPGTRRVRASRAGMAAAARVTVRRAP